MAPRSSRPRPDRPIRVLYVEANEDGSVGGSHQVLFDMVSEIDRSVVEPLVLFHQDNRFAEAFRGIGVTVVTWDEVRKAEKAVQDSGKKVAKVRGFLQAIQSRKSLLDDMKVDLLHMNNSPRSGRTDWLPAARLAGIPVVAAARGDARPLPGKGIRTAVHRWLSTRYDRVIAITEYIAEAWRAQGVPADRVVTVHDGVNFRAVDSAIHRSRDQVRGDLKVPPGRLLVAMVGNIRRWKGQHVVLEALHLLDPSVRDKLFVAFVGAVRKDDEPYFEELRTRVDEWGLSGSVNFTGSRTDVPDIFASADLAVHASVIPEPGGMVILEAMAYGAPVICANRGGPLDFLTPGTGLTHDAEHPAELAAHLTELVEDPERCRSMAEAARVRARHFSAERTARGVEAIYRELL